MRDEPDVDAELEEQLRRLVSRADPVPPELIQAAVDSFTWRSIDAELAELVSDSFLERDEEAVVRSHEQGRFLTFEAADLTIDVEVTSSGPARALIGQLLPPQQAALELRQGVEISAVETDELGRFHAEPLRAGPLSIRCTVGTDQGERRLVTDWVSI